LIVGQWMFHCGRSEHRLALALSEQLEQIGEMSNDAVAQLLGCYTQAVTRFFLGEFVAARAVLERHVGLVEPSDRAIRGMSFDLYAGLLMYRALTLVHPAGSGDSVGPFSQTESHLPQFPRKCGLGVVGNRRESSCDASRSS
jgi:hypothetical protein